MDLWLYHVLTWWYDWYCIDILVIILKNVLSGLRQFLVTESLLKVMKNAFYFMLRALFVLKILKYLS